MVVLSRVNNPPAPRPELRPPADALSPAQEARLGKMGQESGLLPYEIWSRATREFGGGSPFDSSSAGVPSPLPLQVIEAMGAGPTQAGDGPLLCSAQPPFHQLK